MHKTIISVRSRLLVFLTHQLALPVLKLIRQPQVFPYSKEQLQSFPPGSLGRDLVEMLKANQFELLTHYARHDIKHIVLGYPTTDEGEVCLQAFMMGNGHMSFPVFITVFFGGLTMPEYWSSFVKAYKRGKRSAPVADWKWTEIVHEQTRELKEKIFLQKDSLKKKNKPHH
jgi:ubiquinone biosynthesis protein Coq4